MSIPRSCNYSQFIRERALEAYIVPARESGQSRVSIAVRDLMGDFPEFSKGRQSIFCSALKAKPFLRTNGLTIESQDGPKNMRGTSVVYHYMLQPAPTKKVEGPFNESEAAHLAEQLLIPLRGLFTQEIANRGGVEGYMKWVRSDERTA